MPQIKPEDVRPVDEYNRIRDEYRQRIADVKGRRRVIVGDYLNFLFENKETMLYQVQEIVRAEGIKDPDAIQHEIDNYNELIPGPYELKATLLIEIDDPARRKVKLAELLGLHNEISLLVDKDYQIQAKFDERQIDVDRKLSSVQFLTFDLGADAAEAFEKTGEVELLITHPACSYRHPLPPETIDALREDLAAGHEK